MPTVFLCCGLIGGSDTEETSRLLIFLRCSAWEVGRHYAVSFYYNNTVCSAVSLFVFAFDHYLICRRPNISTIFCSYVEISTLFMLSDSFVSFQTPLFYSN
ncbi:unnamed protein product [Brassica oleracea]